MLRQLARAWWGIEVCLADAKGAIVGRAQGTAPTSDNAFCRMTLFSPVGFQRCNQSAVDVIEKIRAGTDKTRAGADKTRAGTAKPGSGDPDSDSARHVAALAHPPVVSTCHMGFALIATPIGTGAERLGFLLASGFYIDEPSAADVQQAIGGGQELAAGNHDWEALTAQVRRLSAAEREQLKDLLAYGAREITAAWEAAQQREGQITGGVSSASGAQFTELIGHAPAMREVYRMLEKVARSESTVLVHGESGTGKELIARAIHYHGPRAKKSFVVQNCSALNDNLLESELFGHMRGAFTGAVKEKKGLFEVADGGTFFLDEIGDMSPALQVKLLRVLQEGTFTPVGATKQVTVDVRIIAASHKDLAQLVEQGLFREDLYYRVNVIRINVPPLRERMEDLPILTDHFLRKHGRAGEERPRLSEQTLRAMRAYAWPGNIRELENEIERLLVLSAGEQEIDEALLSPRIRQAEQDSEVLAASVGHALKHRGTLVELVQRVEAEIIGQGLVRTRWNRAQLAKELGITRTVLNQKCTQYGLDPRE